MAVSSHVIGLMSGSSLDGLDAAWVHFTGELAIGKLHYNLVATETFAFPNELRKRLQDVHSATAYDLAKLDHDFGLWTAEKLFEWRNQHPALPCDLIASHGHTIFHQPHLGFSTQIGHPASIVAKLGVPVVYDFRNLDIAYQGQGAPLVPVGDQWLFADTSIKLNLGGIANISWQADDLTVKAGDICACNQIFNFLANQLGMAYDEDGRIAAQGKVHLPLLSQWLSIPYHQKPFPKSLANEEVRSWYIAALSDETYQHLSIADKMATAVALISQLIAGALPNQLKHAPMLVTGGGAFHQTLVHAMQSHGLNLVIPSPLTINFKEAIIFALLGLLRVHHIPNTKAAATGAIQDTCSGSLLGRWKES